MAGSYGHIITDQGNLVSNETFVNMIENLGDAYETVEEMFGMIWWLAFSPRPHLQWTTKQRVEDARKHYKNGLKLAKQANSKEDADGS